MIFDNDKKLGFGTMRLPLKDPNDETSIDIEQSKKMVDAFINNGFTYFDTAWMYHDFSIESALNIILTSRYPRNKYTIADKMHYTYIRNSTDCPVVFEGQLQRLGINYFDYYLVHAVGRSHYDHYNNCDVFNFVKKKKEQGFIKHLGFSFHDDAVFLEKVLREHPEMDFVQIQFNYLDYESASIQSKKCYEICQRFNKPVVTMETVKGGTLAKLPKEAEDMMKAYNPDLSISSWAIRFAASLDNVKIVLSGMSSIEQVEDNMSYMKDFKPLNDEEQKIIKDATGIILKQETIPCTGCSYCTNGCPKKIPIPKFFSLYNLDLKETGNVGWTPEQNYYHELINSGAKPSDCIKCKQCESVCPQKLKVTEYLDKVKEHFKNIK